MKVEEEWRDILNREMETLKDSYELRLMEKDSHLASLRSQINDMRKQVINAEKARKYCVNKIKELEKTRVNLEHNGEIITKAIGEIEAAFQNSVRTVENGQAGLQDAVDESVRKLKIAR